MHLRRKTRGWLKIALAYVFLGIVLYITYWCRQHRFLHINQTVLIIGISSYLLAQVFAIWGSSDLLQARGYDNQVMLAFVILGFCCTPILILGLPFIISFGLDDKNRQRRRK